MKALKYGIEISDGIIAHMHGCTRIIEEYYFPEVNLTVNGEAVWVGAREERDRTASQEVEVAISLGQLECLKEAIKKQEELQQKVRGILYGQKTEK